ncbi:MAG: hypothetical protein ABL957_16610, partial [Parvularculaceae bacterium]
VVVDEPVVEVAAVHEVEMTPVAEVTVAPVFVDPAARWASMAPGGVTETRQANNPTESWARMRPGRDGRPTMGLKPIGAMAEVWARYQLRRGELVSLEWPDAEDDPLLRMADETFDEWRSAEDEAAYGDLRPL